MVGYLDISHSLRHEEWLSRVETKNSSLIMPLRDSPSVFELALGILTH